MKKKPTHAWFWQINVPFTTRRKVGLHEYEQVTRCSIYLFKDKLQAHLASAHFRSLPPRRVAWDIKQFKGSLTDARHHEIPTLRWPTGKCWCTFPSLGGRVVRFGIDSPLPSVFPKEKATSKEAALLT
jgi:hypothetical protein